MAAQSTYLVATLRCCPVDVAHVDALDQAWIECPSCGRDVDALTLQWRFAPIIVAYDAMYSVD